MMDLKVVSQAHDGACKHRRPGPLGTPYASSFVAMLDSYARFDHTTEAAPSKEILITPLSLSIHRLSHAYQ